MFCCCCCCGCCLFCCSCLCCVCVVFETNNDEWKIFKKNMNEEEHKTVLKNSFNIGVVHSNAWNNHHSISNKMNIIVLFVSLFFSLVLALSLFFLNFSSFALFHLLKNLFSLVRWFLLLFFFFSFFSLFLINSNLIQSLFLCDEIYSCGQLNSKRLR